MKNMSEEQILSKMEKICSKLPEEERKQLAEFVVDTYSMATIELQDLLRSRLRWRTFSAAAVGFMFITPIVVVTKSLFLGLFIGAVFTTLVFYGVDQLEDFLSQWLARKRNKT